MNAPLTAAVMVALIEENKPLSADDATENVINRLSDHAGKLELELSRYMRLEALLRSHSDVEDVPDCGDEQRVRPNQAMSILSEWEGK